MFTDRRYPNTRLRRLRRQAFSRQLVREHTLTVHDLIYPLFIVPGQNQRIPVKTMPGIERYSIDILIKELKSIVNLGIPAIALFPMLPDTAKSLDAQAAYDSHGLIPEAVRAIKTVFPDLGVIADIALDPYTSHGQDGLINAGGEILNDETVSVLIKQALCYAEAGVDILAPSDMMDGRIGAIRNALEKSGFIHTQLLAYSAKFASCFYGPFRDAVGSTKFLGKSSKETYQMDPANANEALHEVALDLEEGADIIMIKPGLPYLDIIQRVKTTFSVPTFAYQVSGEYAQLKFASLAGICDEKKSVMETMIAFKRAGADAIFTYYAKEIAQWLQEK